MKEIICNDTGEKVLNYSEYLNTKHWVALRSKFKSKQVKECVMCGSIKNLNIHHMTYERLGNENFDDLVFLCKDCHTKLHEAIDTDKSKFLLSLKSNKNKYIKTKLIKSCNSCVDYFRGICYSGYKNKNHNCIHHKRTRANGKQINDEYTNGSKPTKKQCKRSVNKNIIDKSSYNKGFGSLTIESVDLSKYK